MISLTSISRDWAAEAVSLAEAQGYLPNSPGEFVDGKYRLCAAACIACAGLRTMQPGREDDFCSSLRVSNSKKSVADAFVSLGLSQAACSETMALNDSTLNQLRLTALHQALGVSSFTDV